MEEKDVQRLIDMLYNMIDEAKSVAFSAEKCAINRDEALDILDEMRAKLPLELKKAKELIAARNDYVAGAKKEVEKFCPHPTMRDVISYCIYPKVVEEYWKHAKEYGYLMRMGSHVFFNGLALGESN